MSGELTAAMTLPEFLSTNEVGTLTVADRQLIVEQALLVLEQTYALLPFKVARYGINPLQRLRLMQTRLGRPGPPGPEWQFHAELVDIFNSLRDLHTRYTLPQPFNSAVAVLPFLLKEFTEGGRRRYLVGKRFTDQGEIDTSFQFGVEVTHWNGVPIARAVDRLADRFPGANAEARHARAVEWFTTRTLAFGMPPDEDWIMVDYLDEQNEVRQIKLVWDVHSLVPATTDNPSQTSDTPLGFDLEAARLARMRTLLFAPEVIAAEQADEPVARSDDGVPVTQAWSTFFEARKRTAGGRTFGQLRIRSFLTRDVVGFVNEFIRLVGELPPDGLVLDIRGNGGGAIVAAELSLQALTGRTVEPAPGQFAATMLNLKICRAVERLAPWLPSLEQALETGASHSAAIPFTLAEWLDLVPQTYFGPVVLITDARCYSAADIFSAGFQDNRIGQVLGIDGNTGAGGGNIWAMSDLLESLEAGGTEFRPMAGGAELSVVIRRVLRVGKNAGTPLEDYGVVPDQQHAQTRADIMSDDADLMATAAGLLAKGKARRFDVALTVSGGDVTVGFDVSGIDRADVIVDGRTRETIDLGENPAPVPVQGVATAGQIRVTGYDSGELVALRTFERVNDILTLRTRLNG